MLIKELRRITVWGALACLIVNAISWPLDIVEGDAAYYAAASLEMIKHHEYFHFVDFDQTHPGLAPLSFWLSHFSMSMLGAGNVAFHIPALLLTLLTLYAVYRFSLLYYSREVALLAVLITVTLQSTFVLNRTADAVAGVTAFYMFTLWQAAVYFRSRRLQNLVLAVLGAILAALSRGTYASNHILKPGYQLVVALWSSGPWLLWMLLAFFALFRTLFNREKRNTAPPEYLTFFGAAAFFLLFLFNPQPSRYDVFILLPPAAIVTAAYVFRIVYMEKPAWYPKAYYAQVFLSYTWLGALFAVVWFPFQDDNYFGLIHFMAMLSAVTYLVFFSAFKNKLIISAVMIAVGTNLVLNSYFYPNLLNYQAGARLGSIAKANAVREGKLYALNNPEHHALHFYSGVRVNALRSPNQMKDLDSAMIYIDQDSLASVRRIRPDATILGSNPDFHGRDIDLQFLNPDTRPSTLGHKMLIGL